MTSPPSSSPPSIHQYSLPPLPSNPRRDQNQTILTLGLELEFLFLNPRVNDDPHRIIKNALETYTFVHTDKPCLPEIRCDIQVGVHESYNRRHFIVMDEHGLDPKRAPGVFGPIEDVLPNGEVRRRHSMEVATPIMRERCWWRIVFGLLDCLEMLKGRGLEVAFNGNTGLHVHVGRRGGWSVCQLKKMVKAVVVFEEAMDELHPTSRVRSGKCAVASNVERMGIRWMSRVRRVGYVDSRVNSRTVNSRDEGLMRISTLANGNNKCTKYNFMSLRGCGTVEFRQGIASLDSDQVGDWVNTVLDFVSAAITTSRKEFRQWARDIDNPDHENHTVLCGFLTQGREYRTRTVNWMGDFEDELPEENEVERFEDMFVLEDLSVPDRKGKRAAAVVQEQLRDNYEEEGRGRNKLGMGESSGAGARYQDDILGYMSSQA